MSTRRQLRAALSSTATKPDRDGPPPELLTFRLHDWIRADAVPESVGADLEDAFAHRASAARRRWSDAGRAWAAARGISERDWLDLRRTTRPAREGTP